MERDDMSVEDVPRRAAWAAAYAGHMNEAADHLTIQYLAHQRINHC